MARVKEEHWQVGEEVMVRWEGSRKYFKAKILRLRTESCQVEFEDGTEKTVTHNDLKRLEEPIVQRKVGGRIKRTTTPSPEKPRRPVGRPRSKTPSSSSQEGRMSSPRRGRRSNAPSSPPGSGRRSSSRGRSSSPARSKKSPTRRPPPTPPTPRRGRKSVSSLELKELAIPLEKVNIPESMLQKRYPTRQRVTPGVETGVKRLGEEKVVGEVKPAVAATSPSSIPSSRSPKGATLLSLLMIALQAVLPVFLYLACTKNKGTLWALPPVPKRVQSYLSPKNVGLYLAWIAFQALLMLPPIGRKASQPASVQQRLQYRMNGLAATFVTAGTISGMAYYQLPLSYFNENVLRTIVSSFLAASLLSTVLYIKSFFTDSRLATNTGNFVYDFWLGRELNPQLWSQHFDLKLFVFRLGMLGMATVDSLLLYKYFVTHGCVSHQLATVASMQLLYVLDAFWREEIVLATSFFLYEGLGYSLVVHFLTFLPFVQTLPVLYLASSASTRPQPWWCLASAGLLFLSGLYLSRKSLSEKYAFKTNPYNVALSHLETIPKDYTRCLISSGLWGMVRHPNYLGEVLMFLAWSLPCGFASAVPYVPLIVTAICLVAQTFKVENGMRRRHGQVWTQYVARVRHRLVPYVF